MIKKFSLTDVVVLKENDILSYDQLSKVIGGVGDGACGCYCENKNCNGNCSKVSGFAAAER